MKKVLIALDYEPTAQKVAETGYDLAIAMGAQVILLHVTADASYYASFDYSPIMGFGGFSGMDTRQPDHVEGLTKAAQEYLDTSKKHLGDEQMRTIIKSGDTGDTILNTALEEKVDIIVMGTHSRRGLEKILLGSVAETVLNRSSIPLFIVPTKAISK